MNMERRDFQREEQGEQKTSCPPYLVAQVERSQPREKILYISSRLPSSLLFPSSSSPGPLLASFLTFFLFSLLQVSLEDMYKGKMTKLALQKTVLCPECEGVGGKKG